jgi:homocysteine S-methyltransferase
MMENSSKFWEKLSDPLQRPFAVELDSPAGPDVTQFMVGARELRDHGAELITVADCPMGRVRADAGIMACKLRRELGMESLPHMSCRDRNWIAVQSLLFGFVAEGIENMLLVTGDPVPPEYREEARGVYHFHSRELLRRVRNLDLPLRLFAALNVNAHNFELELELAREKEENGAVGFLTQPVLTQRALDNLAQAREALAGKLLGGIMPIVSGRNAVYLQREVQGVIVDDAIAARYEGADRERGETLAVEISADFARRMRQSVDGFYLMTPFGRTGLVCRIMDAIRKG